MCYAHAAEGPALEPAVTRFRQRGAWCGLAGGGELYEAAVLLKEVLRGRAALLIQDRIDIVGAAEADGVVLSPGGKPMLPHAHRGITA